jgi:formyl-CoA transferase
MTFMLDFQAARWLQKGEVPVQVGNDHPTGIPQGCFKTGDQNINIGASGDLYPRLCKGLEAMHLVDDPRYDTFQKRSDNRVQLHAEIEEILMTKPAAHWIAVLNEAGVPCGPVNTIDQVFADPQVEHLGVVHYFDHPRLGHKDVVRQPVNLSTVPQPKKFRHPTPDPGEHTDQILQDLGIDAAEIARMREAGTV